MKNLFRTYLVMRLLYSFLTNDISSNIQSKDYKNNVNETVKK